MCIQKRLVSEKFRGKNEGSTFARANDYAVPFPRETKHAMVLIFNQMKTAPAQRRTKTLPANECLASCANRQCFSFLAASNECMFLAVWNCFLFPLPFRSDFFLCLKWIFSHFIRTFLNAKLMKSKNKFKKKKIDGNTKETHSPHFSYAK